MNIVTNDPEVALAYQIPDYSEEEGISRNRDPLTTPPTKKPEDTHENALHVYIRVCTYVTMLPRPYMMAHRLTCLQHVNTREAGGGSGGVT